MRKFLFRFPIISLIVAGMVATPPAQVAGAASNHVRAAIASQDSPTASFSANHTASAPSPESLLNADGTLRLDSGYTGSFDLSGWDVSIDPQRGPIFSANQAAPHSPTPPGDWADLGYGTGDLNGAVYAAIMMGGDLVVGGYFLDVAGIPQADNLAEWNGSSWSAFGDTGASQGPIWTTVNALATDGTNLYVGGEFNNITEDSSTMPEADYIAMWNGSHWSALGSNGSGNGSLNNSVYALTMIGTDLYVGGAFTDVTDSVVGPLPAADFLAKWDTVGGGWSAVGDDGGAPANGSLNNQVRALATDGANLYVGGAFTNVKNGATILTGADYVAKWDPVGGAWSSLGDDGGGTPNGSLTYNVYALAVSGSDLYVGGGFGDVRDGATTLTAADYIARWDTVGGHWYALSSNGSSQGSLNNTVVVIFASGGHIYVGGEFTNVNNGGTELGAADYLARWDGSDWSSIGDNGAGDGSLGKVVKTIAIDGSTLYAGGLFAGVNNGGTFISQARYLAAWDTTDWQAVGSLQGPLDHEIYAMAASGGNLYIGGGFHDLPDHGTPIPQADYIARWDGSNWHALGDNGYGDGVFNNPVYSIAVSGNNVYAGGNFANLIDSSTNLPEADYIAKWDGAHWSALGSDGAGNGSLNGPVLTVAAQGSKVFAAGYFTNVHDATFGVISAADYIAEWDGSNWSALGSDGSGDGSFASGTEIFALVPDGTDLYVGGSFQDVKDAGAGTLTAADYVAKWNGSHWSALGSDGSSGGSLDAVVVSLAKLGTSLYASGYFTNVNDSGSTQDNADYLAKWDGSHWSGLGDNGAGGGALNGAVVTLATRGGILYAGGFFTNASNHGTPDNAADYVASWDGGTWHSLGSNGGGDGSIGGVSSLVRVVHLAAGDSDLFVAGAFQNVNNNGVVLPYADFLARYGLSPLAGVLADFDGNRSSDLAVYRPSNGVWYIRSQYNAGWGGQAGDVPVPGDYNGDGKADVAIYRPSTGVFYVKNVYNQGWGGQVGDVPVPGDYNGDGTTDVGIWRPSTGVFYVKYVFNSGWGAVGDIPVPGDYNGDGTTDVAVFRPSNNVWYIKGVGNFGWGQSGDVPVPGDYNGDGTTDIAVWRPSTGTWYVRGQPPYLVWGSSTDIPVPGDYNGNGTTDLAVYIPSSGTWSVKDQFSTVWGAASDYPVEAPDTNGDGDPYQ